jgi:hypothetical protein
MKNLIIETGRVEKCESDESGTWYNIDVEVSIAGRPFVKGGISLDEHGKPIGQSADAWIGRKIFAEMNEHLNLGDFIGAAYSLIKQGADALSDYQEEGNK